MFRTISQSTPWELASTLAHHAVCGSDTICDSSNSLTRLLGRCFHTLIKNVSFPSRIDVGSHNLLLLEALRIR